MSDLAPEASIDGVRVRHIERIFKLLRERLPKVLEANRYFEEETGIHNEAGANNLTEALSHIATLVENADELDDEKQAEQVGHLEDHLRRSMMEAFEQLLKYRLGEIAKLWEKHREIAWPLERRGRLGDAVTTDELDDLRRRMKSLLEQGRASKRATTWEAWEAGTDCLVQACEVSSQLESALSGAIEFARFERSAAQRRLMLTASTVAASGLVIGVVIGVVVGVAIG